MTTRLDQREWTAAQVPAPWVLCHWAAIMRSPRGKPCHWACATAWTDQHQDQDHEHAESPHSKCPKCKGGGLVPALGCTCNGTAHTCTPVICDACGGTGQRRLGSRRPNTRPVACETCP